MSLKLQKEAWGLPIKRPGAKLLLLAISYLSKDGDVWANLGTLIRMTSNSERTIRTNFAYLVDEGYLHRLDTFHYKIKFSEKLKEDLALDKEDTSELLEDTSVLSEDTSDPYIKNGTITEYNGIISIELFLEGIESSGITREYGESWYHRQEEHGWFLDRINKEPKPYAQKLTLMRRSCLREYNGSDRSFPQKKSKKKGPGVWEIQQHLDALKMQKRNHPGDPSKEVPCSSADPDRTSWWELCKKEKELEQSKAAING